MAAMNKKALTTKEELIHAASEIFSIKWYETVSISDICKKAGRSSGAFYNYYKNKEDIFLRILDRFLIIFADELRKISGDSVESRLDSFLNITIDTGRDNKKLVTVFREGQYRFNEMEQRLKTIYVDALSVVYGRELSETEYLFITGPLRFISIRNLYHNRPYDFEMVKHFILKGLFGEQEFDISAVFAPVEYYSKEQPEKTRDILLLKAAELFGGEGYHKVNIYDITRSSGFAVGTFYRHFKTKEAILIELVESIGKETRALIGKNLGKDLNPLEQTIRGFYIFIKHMEQNPAYYTIVREAEFVVDKAVEEYYDNFEKGYCKQKFPGDPDPVTIANSLSGLGHYFGIEDIFSGNIAAIKESLTILGTYLKSGLSR